MDNTFTEKYQAVRKLVHGELGNPQKTTLHDWMVTGLWETMTAQEIADEWNAIEEDPNND